MALERSSREQVMPLGIATSNTINSNITGYNSLCNATFQSLNARQPVNGLSVTSADGSAGSTGFQVPLVVLASKSLSSGSYSRTNSTISVTVKDADNNVFYTDSSNIIEVPVRDRLY